MHIPETVAKSAGALPKYAMSFTLLIAGFHILHYWQQLPDQVASHFGFSGKPDSQMDKDWFIFLYVTLVAVIYIMFTALGKMMHRIPDSLINIPNKAYWLNEARRKQTITSVERKLLWLGGMTLFFIIAIMHQCFRVSIGQTTGLDAQFHITLAIYLMYVVIWTWKLIAQFRKTSHTSITST